MALAKDHGLTAERLRDSLDYDKTTGTFTWKTRHGNRVAGSEAGCKKRDGYVWIGLDGHYYAAGVLAWMHVTGEWPLELMDHRNLVRHDNRFSNLREASRSQYGANRKRQKKEGLKGATWRVRDQAWQSQIGVNGAVRYLGVFETELEAHVAYVTAANKHFGEFARVS